MITHQAYLDSFATLASTDPSMRETAYYEMAPINARAHEQAHIPGNPLPFLPIQY